MLMRCYYAIITLLMLARRVTRLMFDAEMSAFRYATAAIAIVTRYMMPRCCYGGAAARHVTRWRILIRHYADFRY